MLAGLIFKPMMDKNSTNSFGASEAINEVLQLSNIADLGTKLLKALIAFFGNFGTTELYLGHHHQWSLQVHYSLGIREVSVSL